LLQFFDEVVLPSFPNAATLAVNAIRERFAGVSSLPHFLVARLVALSSPLLLSCSHVSVF
jgi:hypothetical protein